MSAPIVSLIVPVYNAEKYLQTLLQSVQKQSLSDFECICIDDGSVDKSVEIVQNYVKNDTRFNLVRNKKKLGSCGGA
jgi:glycosyltransferase involved in cell wall biosynthesis